MDIKQFKDLSKGDIKSTFEAQAKVEVIKQTGGPTLMVLNDGTSNFTFKAFVKPGVRAFPQIDVGDCVYVKAVVNEHQGKAEGEVVEMNKLTNEQLEKFKEHLERLNERIYMPKNSEFSIDSPVLEALKPRFIQVATIIRKAVVERRPIVFKA